MRGALLSALASGQRVRFHWELYDGAESVSVIDAPAPPDEITITFRSPWGKLRVRGVRAGKPNDIHVNVP